MPALRDHNDVAGSRRKTYRAIVESRRGEALWQHRRVADLADRTERGFWRGSIGLIGAAINPKNRINIESANREDQRIRRRGTGSPAPLSEIKRRSTGEATHADNRQRRAKVAVVWIRRIVAALIHGKCLLRRWPPAVFAAHRRTL
jgi:hypothetical protein